MVTTDGRKAVIAEFHRAHHFFNKRKAQLEVQASGMHMFDYIVLTFVCAAKTRDEREQRATTTG